MEVDCTHPVRLHGLCAYCGRDTSRYRAILAKNNLPLYSFDDENEGAQCNVHILHSNLGLTVAANVQVFTLIDS
jgi:hypothetical protein